MRVAFFSNVSGKNAVTTNLACISVMSAIEHQLQIAILENHSNIITIEDAFVKLKEHSMVRERDYYFNHIGMDHLMKKLHSKMYDNHTIENSSMKFLNNHIYYIPQNRELNPEILESQLYEVLPELLEKAEDSFDMTLIDTKDLKSQTTELILHEAELIVVNLSQNHIILSHFFENYPSLISKSIFFISKYDSKSKYSIKNIMRKYHIAKDKIVAIPYNVELKDSVSEGTLVEFLARNYHCQEGDSNYSLIQALKHGTSLINHKRLLCCKEDEGAIIIS